MPWTIPLETRYSYKQGTRGIVVLAIQRALNDIGTHGLLEDAVYGKRTATVVGEFQEETGLLADKIFGPASSLQMAQLLGATIDVVLPDGLVVGFVDGESSGDIGAVNWSVAGGVDCSYLMRRVLNGSDDATIERAFDGHYQFNLLANTTRERYKSFLARAATHSSQIAYIAGKRERSWRLAALAHNWPYAADRLARGYSLTDQPAPWVPSSVTFKDGAYVRTYWEWAQFYALGAPEHFHPGLVTQFVDDWTP